MAQLPYFVFSPNTLLSVIGLIKGPDTTRPTPADDWREATVDVVIPAFNEEQNIVRCLASVIRQTRRPRRIVLVDDGSADATAARAKAFCEFHGVELTLVQRRSSIGKTPTIREQTRALDSDVQFILDADTVLDSDDYIERTVHDLYQGVGIASACGMVMPLRQRDRREADESAEVRAFVEAFPSHRSTAAKGRMRRFASAVTNLYREVLYLFLQRFVYRGQMAVFGTLINPVGCAVAYRREYLKRLFDEVEPTLGDDLSNSEDIFIGLAMLNEGYRNIQVASVCARTVEPEVQRLPRQIYLWSSAFLQSAFYFDALVRSPFKVVRRRQHHGPEDRSGGSFVPATLPVRSVAYAGLPETAPHTLFAIATDMTTALPGPWGGRATGAPPSTWPSTERRRVREPYRQAFGSGQTLEYGRPAGWAVAASAIEKVGFPTVLLAMMLCGNWEGVLIAVGVETLLTVIALVFVMKHQRLEYLAKGIAVTPIRYALLALELVTIARFASDLWLTKNRSWRK
ncbi:MAG TPA: glycosyltransferase [Vicinamibacterales bacterium]|nr:glycosyltransferase [Vicinamibacterales bacterium]